MKKLVRNTLSLGMVLVIGAGCGGNKINLAKYKRISPKRVVVPEVCKNEYKVVNPKVAVVNFTNNSTFGIANINKSNSSSQSGFAIGATPNFIGAVAGSNTKSYSEKRKVDAKLSQSIVPVVENLILNLGGAEIFTRNDMKKIDTELKFQDSGLIDPQSAVEFGKLSGVKYIITGSIDNVETKYRNNAEAAKSAAKATQNSDNKLVKYGAMLASLVASATDGMLIKTRYTIKILDVESGKIVFSKQLEGDVNIGKIPNPTFDQLVGGIKAAINESLPQVSEDFSKFFAVKGYITDIRAKGTDLIARVNLGSKDKVVENSIFKVYTFEENLDPITNKKSCDRIELETTLRATNQIGSNYTWTTVELADGEEIKIQQLVQKTSKKGGLLNAVKF